MSRREVVIWALASFVVMAVFARFVVNENWTQAVLLGVIVGLIAPAAERAKRHRKSKGNGGRECE
jgi:hypothetical protein